MAKKLFMGLDVGASGVKMSFFRGEGVHSEFVGYLTMDTADEGILSESELYAAVHEQLSSQGRTGAMACVGVPQYQVTTKVADYPAKVGRLELSRLVAMEVLQLSGMTDEALVHGYAAMPSGLGRTHPVLIAMSREDSLHEKLKQLETGGLDCRSLSPSGLALAAACFALVPGLSSGVEPSLVIDIGRDSTMMLVLAGGQVLYVGTLMFGASRFEEAGRQYQQAHRSSVGAAGLQEYLREVDLLSESRQSPLLQAVQALESEIQSGVEHWRSLECEELASRPIPQVYVTGGGSRLRGLCEWLAQILECRVEQVGPQEQGVLRPELTVAYGLGLQACGQTELALSLVPPSVELSRLRRRRWPFLAAAAGLAVSCIFGGLISSLLNSREAIVNLAARQARLSKCVEEGAAIMRLRRLANEAEGSLVEISSSGNGAQRLSSAMRLLSQATLPEGWLICLADADTARASADFFAGASKRPAGLMSGRQEGGEPAPAASGRSSYVCAGFVARETSASGIAGLLQQLGNGGEARLFAGVDRGDSIENGALSSLVWSWRERLNQMPGLRKRGGASGYELFTLNLPFAQPDIRAQEKE